MSAARLRKREARRWGHPDPKRARSREGLRVLPAECGDAGDVPREARRWGGADLAAARRGFSLLEVLVSIGVILALAIALGAFVRDVARSRERLDLAMARQRSADAAIEVIERALATTVVEDAILGTGVRGSAERLEVIARGVPAWRLGSASTRRRSLEDRERLAVVGGDAAVGESLVRRGDGSEAREGRLPATLRFRYHDGEAWRSEFDSVREARLPVAVEVSLWWRRDGDASDDDAADFDLLAEDRARLAADEEPPDDALEERRRSGVAARLDVAREDLGGPMREPDRVRVIAVPDAATASPEGDEPVDREEDA